jgi:hypothetical protein
MLASISKDFLEGILRPFPLFFSVCRLACISRCLGLLLHQERRMLFAETKATAARKQLGIGCWLAARIAPSNMCLNCFHTKTPFLLPLFVQVVSPNGGGKPGAKPNDLFSGLLYNTRDLGGQKAF